MGRKTKGTRIVDGDPDASLFVTVQKIRKSGQDGKVTIERIYKPVENSATSLDTSFPISDAPPTTTEDGWNLNEAPEDSGTVPIETSRKKTQRDYILQFVERVDEFLGALLTRESRMNDDVYCSNCNSGTISIWRCTDCSLSRPMCRKCIRGVHQDDPFHRIQCWTGTHYRSADLWEVGCYILVPHHTGTRICEVLANRIKYLEDYELQRDSDEQDLLRLSPTSFYSKQSSCLYAEDLETVIVPDHGASNSHQSEAEADEDFHQYLDALRLNPSISDHAEEADDDAEDNDGEESAEIRPYLPSDIHSSHPNLPASDAFNNSYIRIVHSNGLHHMALITCTCRGSAHTPTDLIGARLLPASFAKIRTVFTVQVLDHFRLANLELKASAYQFYNLIRRLTKPMAPSAVVDLYNEFRRMSRLWRWMKKLKWAGFAGHNGRSALDVQRGELSNYCVACPQPGVNLATGWEHDPNKFVYQRSLVADGNFKADHVQPKKPSRDIWLSEGGGMIPPRADYHAFLKTAIEKLTGAPCENTFRAITGAMLASKSCDVTGIVGVACARHGCYAPGSLVDLFKGEQQKNVDYALLAAILSTGVDPRQGLALYYDIICQYFVHLKTRIGHLLPPDLKIDRGIGLFHVHAHKDDCLFRFSPAFIPGAACICGEILESLWSKLNLISPTARTATLAHRAEMLDDHATDSNHSKALGMAKYLCKRYVEALETRDCTKSYFEEVSRVITPGLITLWTQQIQSTESRRLQNPKLMDIYAAKGQGITHADPEDNAEDNLPENPVEAWLHFALIVEEKQVEIRHQVRQLTKAPRHADPQQIQVLRDKLNLLLDENARLQEVAGVVETGPHLLPQEDMLDWADEPEEEQAPASTENTSPGETIENRRICLPSYGNADVTLKPVEMKARIAKAKSHLSHIRNLIAEKSFQFSNVIRKAPRKGVRTRSRARVDDMNHQITLYAQLYNNCRACLLELGADNTVMSSLRVLRKEDVQTSTAILDPNTPGSTRIRLSWIWHTAMQRLGPNMIARQGELVVADAHSGDADLYDTDPETLIEFKRVHWLRARAQSQRWSEEVLLIDYEMNWTVRYFLHKEDWWRKHTMPTPSADQDEHVVAGLTAYALRKAAMWHQMAISAEKIFHITNPSYKPCVVQK